MHSQDPVLSTIKERKVLRKKVMRKIRSDERGSTEEERLRERKKGKMGLLMMGALFFVIF
ncbi:MAG: hypothetical protein NT163_07560 [Chlorobiales bacterium]|nr:hypothetical protein [Chlorobiales bacterium]